MLGVSRSKNLVFLNVALSLSIYIYLYTFVYVRFLKTPCLLGHKYNGFMEAGTLRPTHAYPDLAHPLLCSSVMFILIFRKFSTPYVYW